MDTDLKPPERPVEPVAAKLDDSPAAEKPAAETFKTPEEVAADDDIDTPARLVQEVSANMAATDDIKDTKPKPGRRSSWRERLALHWPPGKKEYIVAGVILLLIAGGTAFALTRHQPVASFKPATRVAAKPLTVPSMLSGLPVAPAVNKRPVTAVMVENSTDARPQSGLSQGMVVFEAVAEGGVTRFMALYQDTSPNNVGPIRSARPYYIQWALGFDAAYAHVGGSPDALSDIKSWNVRDLDQFANGSSYHRITSRPAPHNVYTAISTLNQLETTKGYTSSSFTGFPRKPKATPLKQPTAASINLSLSGPDYNVHYDYAAATDSYNRSEGGAAQIDANTNTHISPKVVIAMVIPETQGALDASGAYYSDYAAIGSGPADVFQDGGVTTGTWTKSSNTSQITFTDASGQAIKLNPGQTWLTAISSTAGVSYTP